MVVNDLNWEPAPVESKFLKSDLFKTIFQITKDESFVIK